MTKQKAKLVGILSADWEEVDGLFQEILMAMNESPVRLYGYEFNTGGDDYVVALFNQPVSQAYVDKAVTKDFGLSE